MLAVILKEKVKCYLRKYFTGIKIVPVMKSVFPYDLINRIFIPSSGGVKPQIFNSDGEEMQMVYMADINVNYCLIQGRSPRYILWNHYDKTLPVHFYGHYNIYEAKKEKAAKKCLYLHESKAIIPNVYRYILRHPEIAGIFDYIFTAEEEVLKKYDNALFCPTSGLWYGTNRWGGITEKQVSF